MITPANQTRGEEGYKHPKSLNDFLAVYDQEYRQELDSCDSWIKWCEDNRDGYGVNFYQGMRAALVFNNIKMCQLIRILKKELPNA